MAKSSNGRKEEGGIDKDRLPDTDKTRKANEDDDDAEDDEEDDEDDEEDPPAAPAGETAAAAAASNNACGSEMSLLRDTFR